MTASMYCIGNISKGASLECENFQKIWMHEKELNLERLPTLAGKYP